MCTRLCWSLLGGCFGGLLRRCLVRLCERTEHRKSMLKQSHVLTRLFLDRFKNWCRQRVAKVLSDFLAEFRLLAGESADGEFEIARHQHLHAVAIKSDELAQKRNRQEALS